MMDDQFDHLRRMQQSIGELKLRERMAEMERRQREGNRKSNFLPPVPVWVIVIILLIMLLSIVAFVVGYGLHLL
jgi:hypothetical protein